jgi:hypothetical protein
VKGPGLGTGAICKNDDLTRPCPSLDLALASKATPQAGRCGMSQNCNRTVTEAQRSGRSDLRLRLRARVALLAAPHFRSGVPDSWRPR